jgi:serine/threonine protein kinase
MRGGAVLGEGNYGRVCTLDDLPGDPQTRYVLEQMSLDTGMLPPEQLSKREMVRKYGDKLVFKADVGDAGLLEGEGAVNADLLKALARRATDNTAVDGITPLYLRGRTVLLSVRQPTAANSRAEQYRMYQVYHRGGPPPPPPKAAKESFPIYRYMNGSLRDLGHRYPGMTLQHLLDAARAVVRCLHALLGVDAHHRDIKPDNILFRLVGAPPKLRDVAALDHLLQAGKAKPKFVISDFGTLCIRPTLKELGDWSGTPGFMCPLTYDRDTKDFLKDMREHLRYYPIPAPGGGLLDEDAILRSYRVAVARVRQLHGNGGRNSNGGSRNSNGGRRNSSSSEGTPPGYHPIGDDDTPAEDVLYRVFSKGDIFALGVSLADFEAQDRRDEHRMAPVLELAHRLIMGGPGDLWYIRDVDSGLKALRARLRRRGHLDTPVRLVHARRPASSTPRVQTTFATEDEEDDREDDEEEDGEDESDREEEDGGRGGTSGWDRDSARSDRNGRSGDGDYGKFRYQAGRLPNAARLPTLVDARLTPGNREIPGWAPPNARLTPGWAPNAPRLREAEAFAGGMRVPMQVRALAAYPDAGRDEGRIRKIVV